MRNPRYKLGDVVFYEAETKSTMFQGYIHSAEYFEFRGGWWYRINNPVSGLTDNIYSEDDLHIIR